MADDRQANTTEVVDAAERAADSPQAEWAARAGLVARAIIYLTMGVLALLVANGRHAEVDQRGALAQLLRQPFGSVLVALLALGFVCYALWRLSEAAFGVAGEGRKAGPRLQSLFRGLVYAVLAFSALALLMGSRTSQVKQQRGFTAQVMSHSGGRLLVGALGVAILVVGLALAWEGVSRRFMKHFPADRTPATALPTIRWVGAVGNTARGLVFALAGALVAVAAWKYEPSKASGLDGALKTLRDGSFGFLLVVAALGLVAFGVYGLLEARYRRV